MIDRREALALVGASVLGACSGTQHGSSSEPFWLGVLDTIVSTAGALEPVACSALVIVLPAAAPACAIVGTSLSLLADAINAYRAANGQSSALCALRSAMDSALAARLDVNALLGQVGVPSAQAVNAIAGMLALALDTIVPHCHATAMPQHSALERVRAVYQTR